MELNMNIKTLILFSDRVILLKGDLLLIDTFIFYTLKVLNRLSFFLPLIFLIYLVS